MRYYLLLLVSFLLSCQNNSKTAVKSEEIPLKKDTIPPQAILPKKSFTYDQQVKYLKDTIKYFPRSSTSPQNYVVTISEYTGNLAKALEQLKTDTSFSPNKYRKYRSYHVVLTHHSKPVFDKVITIDFLKNNMQAKDRSTFDSFGKCYIGNVLLQSFEGRMSSAIFVVSLYREGSLPFKQGEPYMNIYFRVEYQKYSDKVYVLDVTNFNLSKSVKE